ncbi:hypothetical protein [Mesorhizobium sp. M1E.F.Ca.ET.063.01.1.1]|uniref:hypothetical protein n=1 Tax=Mesorhizobium sp. M1E.F.Ca.ET.063.01.1.1 TaxID=2496750 RepID=UPI00167ABB79
MAAVTAESFPRLSSVGLLYAFFIEIPPEHDPRKMSAAGGDCQVWTVGSRGGSQNVNPDDGAAAVTAESLPRFCSLGFS